MYKYGEDEVVINESFWEKIAALLRSTRFIAAVVAGLLTLFGPQFGLDQELATSIVVAIIGLIIGDSVRPMEELLKSRRFWVFAATVIAVVVNAMGLGVDPQVVQTVVLAIAAWIVGDSWRVTLTKKTKALLAAKKA